MPRLTDRFVASVKANPTRRVDYYDTVVPGLALRVNLGGGKTWVLRYRVGTRHRRLKLGSYPVVKLAKARKGARNESLRVQTEGADPARERSLARAAGDSFKDLGDAYLKVATKVKRSVGEDDRILRVELLPAWRHRKAKEITRRDVRELLKAIVERPAPVMANRVWALVSRLFNFAIEQDWLDTGNPATRIKKQPETSRDRVLTADELRALWTALEDVKILKRADVDRTGPAIPPMIARGLQVLLLTAQRPGEVFQMRWQDVDLKATWWTIPAEHSKNGEPHRVPLTPRVVTLLEEAQARGPKDGKWVFAGAAGASVAARAKKAAADLLHAKAIAFAFHRHDLRRTAATGMAAAGISRDTIAHVLNHVDRGSRATAVYDRFSYDPQKRTALKAWDRRFEAILREKTPADNVVPMQRGARSGGAA